MDMKNINSKLPDIGGLFRNKALLVILVVIAFFILFNPLVVVSAGHRGVIFSQISGVSDKVLGEGVHIIIPVIDKVTLMDVRVQKEEVNTVEASSKDLQSIHSSIVLNYTLQADKVKQVYQEIGPDISNKIIIPAILETVKAVTAKYTAEELITKREMVRNDIMASLQQKLSKSYVSVNDFNLTNFQFSETFETAIEAKQVAEQNALKAKNDLERIKVEAQQRVTQATAEAQAIKIQAEALSYNSQLVQLEAVKKWDGKLPQTMLGNSGVPFINIKQ